MQRWSTHANPGEQSHAVSQGLPGSGTHTCAAQSRQVGQLGTQVQRYPDGQVDWASQVEMGAGHINSGLGGSTACALDVSQQHSSAARTAPHLPVAMG